MSEDDSYEPVSEEDVIQFKREKKEEISIITISSSIETVSGDKYVVAKLLPEKRMHNKTKYLVNF